MTTMQRIELLASEAAKHNDAAQVDLCLRALMGDAAAEAECMMALRNAEAQDDE